MTKHDDINLSRRSVLAGLGTVGIASAGAGLGTTAYFSDREDFSDNSLTAGEFDLKVDWQQSYYSGKSGEDPEDHTTWQKVNAFPDADGDDVQDTILTRDQLAFESFGSFYDELSEENRATVESAFRDQFADLPDDFEQPVIDLGDVKPGDKGEITISMHLFDNPGYIWLGGELVENAENSVNEPEADDPDEDQEGEYSPDEWDTYVAEHGGVDDFGEIAQEIQARLWYDDDCDNSFDEGNPCIQFAIDNTDSMGGFALGEPADDDPATPETEPVAKDARIIDAIEDYLETLDTQDGSVAADGSLDPAKVGLTLWGDTATNEFTPTADRSAVTGTDGGDYASSTGLQKANHQIHGSSPDLPNAIDTGATALGECAEDDQRIMVVITNGINVGTSAFLDAASANHRLNGGEVDRYIVIGVSTVDSDDVLGSIESLPGSNEFIFAKLYDEIDPAINGPSVEDGRPDSSVAEEIGFGPGGSREHVIAEGSLHDVLTQSAPNGVAVPTGYPLDAHRGKEGRQCYPNSDTRCVALQWELPVDHANEIQSDSAEFSLNLYGEQCRHNDGSNPEPFNASTEGGTAPR